MCSTDDRVRVTKYKVVETQTVTDEDLEAIVNKWVTAGWTFDGIQFAMREASKRPAMAFVIFTRTEWVVEEKSPPELKALDGGADAAEE